MRLRILHISTRLILGGSQENTVLSCEGQAREGHEVHLAYGPIYGPEGSMLPRLERFNARASEEGWTPITLHELPHMVRQISPVKDHFCFHHDLKRLMRSVRPDVVHTHSSKAGILGRWAAWSARPRPAVVHTIHGPPFMPVEGGGFARMRVRLKNRVYTFAERFAARRCHTIVSVADAMTEQFLARGIGAPEQYITVRSGMETEAFLIPREGESRERVRAELGIGAGDFVVGTVARLAQHQGHDDVLDAIGDDLRAHADWKLLWVGDGWWRERLLARVRAMGLEERVICTGLVPPERVPAMMRAMDVLAHPSAREGLPRTVPQALLCGVCPVAYDVDGTREACIDGRTGRLIPPGDTGALGDAIRELWERPDERARMAQQGLKQCAAAFSAPGMVRALDEVYRSALARAGRPLDGGDAGARPAARP
ncbi:MAG: glycosyltransferase [Phycisphaerales bacterium JB059]